MARLTIYKSDQCLPCKKLVPIIRKNARAKGDKVKVVDIDSCKSKECTEVSYTPTILRDGKKLKDSELEAYLK